MKSKAHSRIKVEILVLLSILLLKAVDIQTNCVLGATAGILKRTAKILPNNVFVHNALGDTYYCLEQFDKGDAALRQADMITLKSAIRENPNDAQAYLNLGDQYYYGDNFEQAIECYENAAQLDPNHAWKWESLGNAYSEQGDYDRAVDAYKEALALNPNYRLYGVLKDCCAELGQPKKAAVILAEIVKADPAQARLRFLLVYEYVDSGKYQLAEAEVKYLMDTEQESPIVWLALGDVQREQGLPQRALQAYQHAIQLEPSLEYGHFNLGQLYLQMGEEDKALTEYETLKELNRELATELHDQIERTTSPS